MGIAIYKPMAPARIEEMFKYQPSINMLLENHKETDIKKVIYMVIMKYLQAFDIDRIKINDAGVEILVEQIILEHGNLELQELEYALKKGLVGAYGAIYGDIRIDTVFTWFTTYKEQDRRNRPEPAHKEVEYKLTGEERTLEEYYKRYPEEEKKLRVVAILDKAKQGKIRIDDIKEYYKNKGLTLNDLKDDMEVLSAKYQNMSVEYKSSMTENQYICLWACGFIKESWNKKIE